MDLPNAYFSRLLPTLAERSRNAALSRMGFAHPPLYTQLMPVLRRSH